MFFCINKLIKTDKFKTVTVQVNFKRKLNKEELIRAIRFSIASEFEAIQIYEQIAGSIDDKFVKQVLLDITEEEKNHVGEFLKVLEVIVPKEIVAYDEGKSEVEEKFM